jgi:hypothetical protein
MATIWGSSEDIGDAYAPSLNAALQQLSRESGTRPVVLSPYGGLRTLAQQRAISPGVANPASSDHVKGRGVDISNYAAIQRVIGLTRFKAVMAEFGWRNIQIDGKPFPSEPWHYANHSTTPAGSGGVALPGTTPTPDWQDEDMARMQILYDVTATVPDAQKRVLFVPGALWLPISAAQSIQYAALIAALDTAQGVTGLQVKTLNCSAASMAAYKETVPVAPVVPDFDEAAFAQAIAPLLPELSLSEADLTAIATAAGQAARVAIGAAIANG